MEMVLGFAVLLVCLFLGIRHGGIGLAVISVIGLMLYTFVFHYKPGTPPIGVMLTGRIGEDSALLGLAAHLDSVARRQVILADPGHSGC